MYLEAGQQVMRFQIINGNFNIGNIVFKEGVHVNIPDLSATNFLMYPNPANDHIIIEIPFIEEDMNLKIYNIFGQIVLSTNIIEKNTNLNTSYLDQGLYYINIEGRNIKTTQKLLIK